MSAIFSCFNLIYCVAYSGDKVSEVNQNSNQMLEKLEKEYPDVLSESMHPIWEHKQPF